MTVPLVAEREPAVFLCVGLQFPESVSALSSPVLTIKYYKFELTPPPPNEGPQKLSPQGLSKTRMKTKETLENQRGFHTKKLVEEFKHATAT